MTDMVVVKNKMDDAGKELRALVSEFGGLDGFNEAVRKMENRNPREDIAFEVFDQWGDASGEYTDKQGRMLDIMGYQLQRRLNEAETAHLGGIRYLAEHSKEIAAVASYLDANLEYLHRVGRCIADMRGEYTAQAQRKADESQALQPENLLHRITALESKIDNK